MTKFDLYHLFPFSAAGAAPLGAAARAPLGAVRRGHPLLLRRRRRLARRPRRRRRRPRPQLSRALRRRTQGWDEGGFLNRVSFQFDLARQGYPLELTKDHGMVVAEKLC